MPKPAATLRKPALFEFFLRGYPLINALEILAHWDEMSDRERLMARRRWDDLTEEERRILNLRAADPWTETAGDRPASFLRH